MIAIHEIHILNHRYIFHQQILCIHIRHLVHLALYGTIHTVLLKKRVNGFVIFQAFNNFIPYIIPFLQHQNFILPKSEPCTPYSSFITIENR